MRGVLKDRFGPKTRLKLVAPPRGLFGRKFNLFGTRGLPDVADISSSAASGLIQAVEERSLWGRFGL